MIIQRALVNDSTGVARVQVESWRTTYRDLVPDEYLNAMTVESRELNGMRLFKHKQSL